MKTFLIIAGILFSSPISFSASEKTFPTAEGFTTDKNKALKIVFTFPPTRRVIYSQSPGTMLEIYSAKICAAIGVREIRKNINGIRYRLNWSQADFSYNKSRHQVSILCTFRWKYMMNKNNPHDSHVRESPNYYILK